MNRKKWKTYLLITVITFGLTFPILDFGDTDQLKSISLNIDKIIELNADQSRWPKSVTGVWGDAVVTGDAVDTVKDDPHTGYLILSEQNGEIKGVSTTGNSLWIGTVRNGVITADYAFEGIITGSLQLRLSPDGSSLHGTWKHNGGISGTYSAYRSTQVDKAALVEHLRDRMGNSVSITE